MKTYAVAHLHFQNEQTFKVIFQAMTCKKSYSTSTENFQLLLSLYTKIFTLKKLFPYSAEKDQLEGIILTS